MSTSVTVVISCAGTGSRLGLGTTKALVEILGHPLIYWQLALLNSVDDIRVVVGHDAPKVIEVVRRLRPNAMFVFNHEFRSTGTAASLASALRGTASDAEILSLDGDLLVEPQDLAYFLEHTGARLGLIDTISSDPVFAICDDTDTSVIGFTRAEPPGKQFEWSGLCRLPAADLKRSVEEGLSRRHVFEMLAQRLPIPFRIIEAREIDTPQDFARAEAWLSRHRDRWMMPK